MIETYKIKTTFIKQGEDTYILVLNLGNTILKTFTKAELQKLIGDLEHLIDSSKIYSTVEFFQIYSNEKWNL